jgi:glycosyltransferase involved in cell wall biosynthesis
VTPDVSVIVVAHESRDLLARCLAALDADAADARTSREVIVVDQASTDGTADWLRAERADVVLVALEQNVGFGAGNNRGLAVAGGRYALLLNSDAFVDPGCIDELVRFAEERGWTVAQLAVAWTLANPAVHVAITGARRPAHIEGVAPAAEIDLSDDELAEIDELIDCDLLICAEEADARETVAELGRSIGLRPIDAGPLSNAGPVEGITAVLATINRRYKIKNAGIKITGI